MLIDTLKESDPDKYYAVYDAAKQTHLDYVLAKIDLDGLTSLASEARKVIRCRIPALGLGLNQAVLSQMAGQNCHLDLEFDDGVLWVVRLRLCDPLLPPQPVQDYIFLSEVATLEFLEETAVPSPKAYLYQLESLENPVGTSFVLMEKMPGTALQWNDASSEQRTKAMEQLMDILLELEKHPLEKTVSIVPADVRDKVGGFAQTPLFETPEKTLGPFQSSRLPTKP